MGDTSETDKSRSERQEAVPTASSSDGSAAPGGRIGKYKILSILGEGGYGMVYLAEQQGLVKRRVALKVIKPGMDTKQVIARFEAERQALALLDHPNIAHVYDAGTTEAGRPYFVMEYVKGVPITEHCDRYKSNIEDRLALFLKICEAVQHAHQKGIIHRDIKPSNIIVAIEGNMSVPKIIDFGVAKALSHFLTERTLVTEHGQMLGTPEYMSPEQAEMTAQDIDTRSDIYSMGVVLYELLTGALPFDPTELREGGLEHIRHVICEQEPKTPSTRLSRLSREESIKFAQHRHADPSALQRRLRGDLDWITLKAMEKDRTRRYASVGEFAADITRHLNNEPVLAGPPSTIYRAKKFVRRNRALVIGTASVLAVLIAGVVGIAIFAVKAERRRTEAQIISNFLRDDVLSSARRIMGREATVRDVLDAASKNLENKFIDKPLVEASIRATLGGTYWDLGDYRASALHRERAYRIYVEQLGEKHNTTMDTMNGLAVSYNFAGKYGEAEKLWERLIKQLDRPWLKLNLACMYARQGRYGESEQLFLEMLEPAYWDPNNTNHSMVLMYSWDLAKVYREQGRYEDAEELFVKSLEGQRLRFGEKGRKDTFNRGMIRCMNELARLYVIQNHYDEAEYLFAEGIKIGNSQLPGKDHPFTLRHVNGLGVLRTKQQRYEEAKTLFNQALAGRKLKLGEDHPETLETINDLGLLHREQKHYEQAEEYLTEALEGRKIKLGPDHPHTLESMHELAVLYKEQGLNDKAEQLLREAVEGRIEKLGQQHPHTLVSIRNLIDLYGAWGKSEQAEQWRAKLSDREQADK
jgi:serine/threonine protein kinase